MENIYEDLIELLKQYDVLLAENGQLHKNKVRELGLKNDRKLIELLLSDPKFKKLFFSRVGDVTIFDKDKFIGLVYNKKFLLDSYTEYSQKIGLASEKEMLIKKQDVVLNWPYKDCMLEGGMTKEDKGRDEIFWNEIIAPEHITRLKSPKAFTNGKRIDAKGTKQLKDFRRGQDGTIKDNLIIKGNNLLALYSLRKEFVGKVKLVYIDPPYNTGGVSDTFTYNNSFNHSTWLTFMKNRLEEARALLRTDGFIVVAIDHCEVFYLGTLMDEVFDRGNRLGVISVLSNPRGRQFANFFAPSTEYMLVYARSRKDADFNQIIIDQNKKEKFDQQDENGFFTYNSFLRKANIENKLRNERDRYCYPIYVSTDLKEITTEYKNGFHEILPKLGDREYCWSIQKDSFKKDLETKREEYAAIRSDGGIIQIYKKYRAQQMFLTHWFDKKYNATFFGTRLLERMLGRKTVSYVKSLYTLIDVLKIMTSERDIVIDFFAGSGTTAHAALDLNKEDGGSRQFILVEQLDMHVDTCLERIEKVISNENLDSSFVSVELAEWNQKWVKEIKQAKTAKEIQSLWEKIKTHSFLSYKVDVKEVDKNAKEFSDLSIENKKKFLLDCLDANHLYINYSEIDDEDYGMKEVDKQLSRSFYNK